MSALPVGWSAAKIVDLCKLENGRAFKPTEWTNQGLPIVRIQNLNRPDAPFNYYAGNADERYRLRGGELLFAWSGTPGTSFGAHIWRGADAVLNQHIFRVDFNPDLVEKRFFRHAINQKLNELIDVAHGGVGLRHVTKGVFENTEIALPPLPEQKRIADKLDRLLARVDACRERLDRVPALLKRFRQSVLAAATSGELTREWRGGAEADWTFERAEAVCDKVQSGGTPKAGFATDGIPFLKVYNLVDQKVDFDYKPQYVSLDVHRTELRKSEARPGDVLMNIVGPPLGKVAIVPDSHEVWNINQAITLFRPSERICSKWIYHLLCSGQNIATIQNETRGSAGQVNISLSQCRDFVFPVPPMPEQLEIVRRIDEMFDFVDSLETKLSNGNSMVRSAIPAILAKAFRGELVPQDPNDEPAAALLARIAAARDDAGAPAKKRRRSSMED